MNPHVAMDAHIARRAAATEAKPWLTRGITIEAPLIAVALWDEVAGLPINALTVPLAEMAEARL